MTRLTRDLQNYIAVSIAADSRSLVATHEIGNRNIWIAPDGDAKKAKQITFGAAANDGYYGIALMPDGRIVYTSPRGGNVNLWIMDADGTDQKQLTNVGQNTRPTITPDGRYIFFQSDRSGDWRIWRIDADGGSPTQMTDKEAVQKFPLAAPDGQWIYFTNAQQSDSTIWKVPVDGGEPVRVSPADNVGLLAPSPDGKLLAFQRYDRTASIPWQQGLMKADTAEIVRWFDHTMPTQIGWSADSRAVVFLERPAQTNLLQQAIDGGSMQPLTHFDYLSIQSFALSADGRTIVLSRGNTSIEAVLISDFR